MKMPWTNKHGPAKVVAVCATVLLISAGSCGLQLALFNAQPHWLNHFAGFLLAMGYVEVAAMFFSIAIGAIAVLVWAFTGMYSGRSDD